MATHGKFLYKTDVNGIKRNGKDITIGVYGLFNTEKALWTYFVISVFTNSSGNMQLSDDICSISFTQEVSYFAISKYGKKVQTVQDGEKYCIEFKTKWESGSNNTTSEIRDKKLDELFKNNDE